MALSDDDSKQLDMYRTVKELMQQGRITLLQSSDNSSTITISVELMGRRFSFACPLGEREALMAAARLLDERMRHIRDSGRIVDAERIAILAALNLTHDLRQGRSSPPVDIEAIERKIQDIENTAQSTISSCSAS